ncbi:MAG: hypothetical protein AAGA18_13930 [Verrucomicrobiota bacterium]
MNKWYPELEENGSFREVRDFLEDEGFGESGLVEGTKKLFKELVFKEERCYDKLGILQEAVRILNEESVEVERDELRNRVSKLCQFIGDKVDLAEGVVLQKSGKQSVARLVQDFQKKYHESANVFDLLRVVQRIEKETDLLGIDGDGLRETLRKMRLNLITLRDANQKRITGDEWLKWSEAFDLIRKNPLMQNLSENIKL